MCPYGWLRAHCQTYQGITLPIAPAPQIRTPRVVWTDLEKDALIRTSVDVQAENPDLAGLPLIRVAMSVLPGYRRRKLIAVTQAPWFEPGIARETKRRTAEMLASSEILPISRANAEASREIADNGREWLDCHREWRAEVNQHHENMLSLLAMIVNEMRTLNSMIVAATKRIGSGPTVVIDEARRRPKHGNN